MAEQRSRGKMEGLLKLLDDLRGPSRTPRRPGNWQTEGARDMTPRWVRELLSTKGAVPERQMENFRQAAAAPQPLAQPPGIPSPVTPGRPGVMDQIRMMMMRRKQASQEEEMMKAYLRKAMQEAQAPTPLGSGAVAPAGAGQATVDQMGNRGRDLDEMIRQAGG